jgi:transcriptional regulator of acetoin/glycerol metabolism
LHPWPFNVRELQQIAAELKKHGGEGMLDLPAVAGRLASTARVTEAPREKDGPRIKEPPPSAPAASLDQDGATPSRPPAPSRDELVRLLQEHQGNISQVAREFGRSRRQVDRWIEQHGLSRRNFTR